MLDNKDFKIVDLPDVSPVGISAITIGSRKKVSTQSKTTRFRKYKKEFLLEKWNKLSPFEMMVMCFLSEAKSLSTPQIQYLFYMPHKQNFIAFDGLIATIKKRYKLPEFSNEQVFKFTSKDGIYTKLDSMRKAGLIDSIVSRANNVEIDKDLAPSLSLAHFFLTEKGTQILALGSGINKNDIGFVPNYKTYSFGSLLHLTEANDFFTSIIIGSQDLLNNNFDKTGILDVTLWENEKNSTHKFELNQEKIIFKPDGFMTLFSGKQNGFVSFYLEYDVGSGTKAKINHKIVAYLKFIIAKNMAATKEKVVSKALLRRSMLLFVTTSESRIKLHQQVISRAIKKDFPNYLDYFNKRGRVAITSTALITKHSPLGKIWRTIDLETGELSTDYKNLLSLDWNKEE